MKDIKNYEGLYAVTSCGRVWSYISNKFLKAAKCTSGYLFVNLYKNGEKKQALVHRLVAEAYIPNPYNKSDVNHINENKEKNYIKNLEWTTHKENCNHGVNTKKTCKPVYCYELNKVFESALSAARELGLDNSGIGKCCRGVSKTIGGYHFKFAEVID